MGEKMKASILTLLVAFACSMTLRGQEYCTTPLRFFDEQYVFVIPAKLMDQAPEWEGPVSAAPLSPESAAKLAVQRLASAFPLIPRWRVEAITLKRVFSNRWIYLVEASDISTAVIGTPWKLVVPVLLNGVTVEPSRIPPEEMK